MSVITPARLRPGLALVLAAGLLAGPIALDASPAAESVKAGETDSVRRSV
ncbi:hypothetical protein [Brevibacterium casei]|nr:hypothetical protein [Brevibacterium casei]